MVVRLNAKEAASRADRRLQELEEEKKREQIKKTLAAAEEQKIKRKWCEQSNKIILSALNGEFFTQINENLIGADVLIDFGLEVLFFDASSLRIHLEKQKNIRNNRVLDFQKYEDRINKEKNKINREIKNKTSQLLQSIRAHERYAGLTEKRLAAVKEHFNERLQDFRMHEIESDSGTGELFHHLFDSSMSIYKPIDTLFPLVQNIQAMMQKAEELDEEVVSYRLDEEEESVAFAGQKSNKENFNNDSSLIKQFTRTIKKEETAAILEIRHPDEYFIISWESAVPSYEALWSHYNLLTSGALGWLCSDENGQRLFEKIENAIEQEISKGSKFLDINAERDPNGWYLNYDIFLRSPPAGQLGQVLEILQYKVEIKSEGDSLFTARISW